MNESTRRISADSGFQRNMGYRVERAEGRATVTLDLAERHLNRAEMAHGGTIMALFDAAMGYAAVPMDKDPGYRGLVTVTMNTNFIRPVMKGSIRVEGHLIGGGRKLVFCEAQGFDDNDELFATCTGTFRRFVKTTEPQS